MLQLSDEDYPEQETEIIVQGTFETYKNQMMRLCIAGSQMRICRKKIRREKMDHEGIREKD